MTGTTEARFAGMRVLVLEDEALVAMLLEDMLADLGCETVGPFAELADAEAFVAAEPAGADAAIIDVNVAGEASYPLATRLAEGGIPFAFSTGYDPAGIPAEWRGRPALSKPFMLPDVERVLRLLRSTAPA
ncbi:response regulator [Stella sp.]|uniref:response regulator n=1 Tax=Stella sp. TaxID=2912054 RepID=UPI0035AF14B2